MKFLEFVEINPRIELKKYLEYPCVFMDEVEPGRKWVSGNEIKMYKGGTKFQKGDTLFARITPCLENGKIAKYKGDKNNFGFGSTEFFVFRAKEGISDEDYIYYLSQSDIIRKPAEVSMFGASGRQRADLDFVQNIQINPPHLKTQRKIAAILSAYDDLIENNARRIKILEEIAQRLYREWFVHFRYPGYENVKMIYNDELGKEIPEGWEVKQLKEFGEIITGKTPSKKEPKYYGNDIPFIKTPDMHGNIFCISTNEYLSELGAKSQQNKTLPPNTICVSCIGTAGIVSIIAVSSQTNQQINAIVSEDDSVREYLFFTMLKLKEMINLHGATGATMVNLNKGKFESLRVLYPVRNLIKEYHKISEPIFNIIQNLQYLILSLSQTRDLLLPRLISGKIDVKNLEIEH